MSIAASPTRRSAIDSSCHCGIVNEGGVIMSGSIITGAVASVAGQVVGALDGLFTSDDERNQANLKIQTLLMQPQILQAVANIKTAEHPDLFVAGARPALMWVCALGFGWEFLLRPLLGAGITIASLWGGDPELLVLTASELPSLDIEQLLGLTLAMLGLAGYRTMEKKAGVARDRLRGPTGVQ